MTTRLNRVLKLVNDMNLPNGAASLDAGCGHGHFFISMSKRGCIANAIDTSEAMLVELFKNFESANQKLDIKTDIASIKNLPLEIVKAST